MSGLQNPKVRERVWDPLVRLFHWSLAIAFFTAWFESSEAAIHETAGKTVLVLIVIRTVWGLIGPFSATLFFLIDSSSSAVACEEPRRSSGG